VQPRLRAAVVNGAALFGKGSEAQTAHINLMGTPVTGQQMSQEWPLLQLNQAALSTDALRVRFKILDKHPTLALAGRHPPQH
jgi:hypothetical protein